MYDSLTPDGCRAAVSARGGAAAPAFYFDCKASGSKAQEVNRRNAAKRNALSLVDDRERLDDDRAVRLEDPGTTEGRVRLFAEEVARSVLCVEDPVVISQRKCVYQLQEHSGPYLLPQLETSAWLTTSSCLPWCLGYYHKEVLGPHPRGFREVAPRATVRATSNRDAVATISIIR